MDMYHIHKTIRLFNRDCLIEYEKKYENNKEYEKNKSIKIALNMIVKNEQDNIERTLTSVLDFCDLFVILDTGSEDDTKSKIIKFCEKHKKSLYIISYFFENFSVNRNIAIEYANNKADYLLFMDSNDEIKNYNPQFKNFLFENLSNSKLLGIYIKQEWNTNGKIDRYFNIRLVKTKNNWHYKAPVHEYITCPDVETNGTMAHVIKIENGPYIFQDRSKDAHKSVKRFTRDKELLYNEYLENNHDTRTLFYLAQTCSCLNQYEESYKYYILRTKEKGFLEEIFHSFQRAADISQHGLNHSIEETIYLYLKSLETSCKYFNCPRAEPCIRIAEIYLKNDNKLMAHTFIKQACQSIYPNDCSLFVDGHIYDYTRWHMLGITGFYVNDSDMGFIGTLLAYKNQKEEIDKNNMKTYVDCEKYDFNKLISFIVDQPLSILINLFIVKKKDKNIQNHFLVQNVKSLLDKFQKK